MRIYLSIIFSSILLASNAQDTTFICINDGLEIHSLEALNTRSLEFSPAYYGDGLVFVVARERNRLIDRKTGQAYFDLMYSDIGPEGSMTRPENFSPNIRTQYHEGPTSFSQDETEIFFTRSNLKGGVEVRNSKKEVQLKIYRGVKGADDWEQIAELPFSSDEYSIAHPALSADGRWLVFSSNMPGGAGGMDLYVAERMDGIWQTPKNLGSLINTSGNEVFPFWHEGGLLFFSSDGRGGHGGLDIYVTSWTDQNSFTGLQHLLFPFNSGRDDLGFIVSSDGRSGFVSSDRKPTKGKDDMYRWTSPQSIFCSPDLYKPMLMEKEILVTNESGDPVSSAYIWMIPMNQEGPSMHKEIFNTELVPNPDQPGAFYLKWGVTDTLSTETADALSATDGRLKVMVDADEDYAVVVQHNEYVPFVSVMPASRIPAYIRLMMAPEKAVNCYNTLFTVYNAAGTERLEGSQITISGQCLRKPVGLIANSEGNAATCLPAMCAVKAEFTAEGYAPHSFTFSPSEEDEHWTIYLKDSDILTAPPSPIATGTIIVLDNIYYDFNKSVVRASDAGELNALANILKEYPDLTIEMTSHTDTRGTSEYNLELSRRRSESAKNYLLLSGIDESRIITRAAGETMPRNECVDGVPCTEAQHQYNRRTEVRIINPAEGMQVKYKSQG
jgi:outer membrane protein OmpA-like peptidoglycan-associated protein